ncbi:MAG: ribose-phosphate diphosphokinase [Candidatus Binatia bacterium]
MPATRIHAFPDALAFARRLAAALRRPLRPVALRHFPDGESLVRVDHRAGDDAILVRALHDPNAKLVEVILAADALRHAGARHLTLVAPYLPYMRQDARFAPGEPISQRIIGALLGGLFERVLTVEAHLHRVRRLAEVVPGAARSLSAAPAVAAWVTRHAPDALLVGPDAESAAWVRAVARRAGVRCVVGDKARLGSRRVRLTLPPLPAGHRRAVLLDDIASSGATLAASARLLRRAGCTAVDVVVVHALCAPGALQRIRRAGVRRIVSCDTVPHRTNAIAVAPLLAAALRGTRGSGC